MWSVGSGLVGTVAGSPYMQVGVGSGSSVRWILGTDASGTSGLWSTASSIGNTTFALSANGSSTSINVPSGGTGNLSVASTFIATWTTNTITLSSGVGLNLSAPVFVRTAPTISSGFNTSGQSISANNGTAAFTVTTGSGTAQSVGTIGMPTATTGGALGAGRNHAGKFRHRADGRQRINRHRHQLFPHDRDRDQLYQWRSVAVYLHGVLMIQVTYLRQEVIGYRNGVPVYGVVKAVATCPQPPAPVSV